MSLWEYKVITSGKGGFATPALLESYLNQLGNDEWEIIEFRTQPDNILAFSGLVRRPTQRDWTLEAAAAAAARAEADKLRAEFAAKFEAATNPSAPQAKDESGNPKRDDTFRRPRDTDSDQDPYALDDSSSEEAEEIPAEDELPTFFEAIRPHMRRNQKGPGYSVGAEYLIKKFEMMEDDFLRALTEVGFALPEDEDDKPVYIEYDGDIYWLNINRRGELWINTREKPRQVFKTVKATRLSPEEPAGDEAVDASAGEPSPREARENRRNERNEQRNRRNEQRNESRAAQPQQAPAASDSPATAGSAEASAHAAAESSPAAEGTQGAEGAVVVEKPSREASPGAPLPAGLALLERIRPMMRRSRGGWSGTISYLSRALRHSDAELLAAFAGLGLVTAANPAEKSPLLECGPLVFWLNKDGRGGIWINAREARRMRQEQRPGNESTGEPAAPAGETFVPTAEPLAEAVQAPVPAQLEGVAASVVAQEASLSAAPADLSPLPSVSPSVQPPLDSQLQAGSVEEQGREVAAVPAAPAQLEQSLMTESAAAMTPPPSSLPLAGLRLLLKETRTGGVAGELCFLAEKLGKNPEQCLDILVATGLKVPEKPREKPVFVEHGGEVFWLNRNAKGELWLNAKASKYSRKEDEAAEEESADAAEEGSDSAPGEEKKPRRAPRGKRKSSPEQQD